MSAGGFNPYQAPQAPYEQPPASGDFSIGQAFTEARVAVGEQFGTCLITGLVFFVLTFLAMITIIGYFVVVPVLAWGGVYFLLRLLDKRAEPADIFAGFSNYGTNLGRMLLLVLFFILVSFVAQSVSFIGMFLDSEVIQGIGALVNLAITFVVMVRLYFAGFFIVDRDADAVSALKSSWDLTSGRAWKVLGFALVSVLVAMSGVLALFIGLIFTIPVSYAMWASAYRQMTRGAALPGAYPPGPVAPAMAPPQQGWGPPGGMPGGGGPPPPAWGPGGTPGSGGPPPPPAWG